MYQLDSNLAIELYRALPGQLYLQVPSFLLQKQYRTLTETTFPVPF